MSYTSIFCLTYVASAMVYTILIHSNDRIYIERHSYVFKSQAPELNFEFASWLSVSFKRNVYTIVWKEVHVKTEMLSGEARKLPRVP